MDRFVSRLAQLCALAGGVVLSALVLMTCVSIVGRAFSGMGFGPVPGDFELVEAGIAFCVFAFLPWCQLNGAHATVDIFTVHLSRPFNRVILAFWEIVFAATMVLLAWRLWVGTLAKAGNGETTLLLQFPLWWAFALCLVPASVAVIVALWSAFDRLRGALTGRDTRPLNPEGSH